MTPQITLNPLQREGLKLAQSSVSNVLFRGGSRSGKSYLICFIIILRAMLTPGSRHGIFRGTSIAVRKSIFDLTLKKVFNEVFPGYLTGCKINDTEMTVELPNGAIIMCGGLERTRLDANVLGLEFSTVWINECNDSVIDFDTVDLVTTRLNESLRQANGTILQPKAFFDCNPLSKRVDWTYKAFKLKIDPRDKKLLGDPNDWAEMKLPTEDDARNLHENYIKKQSLKRGRAKARFHDGEWYDEVDNAMFDIAKINEARLPEDRQPDECDDLLRIIVAVDPAGSSKPGSDEHGIIVAGIDAEKRVHILDDVSTVGDPTACMKAAQGAYRRWRADKIVVERNNGAEWLPTAFKNFDPTLNVGTVWASRGKQIRAEPVSGQCDEGKVVLNGEFEELESQIETFTIDYDRTRHGSPDRLDAFVWAVTELAITEQERRGGSQQKVTGFWR